jgi:hypothetical protein
MPVIVSVEELLISKLPPADSFGESSIVCNATVGGVQAVVVVVVESGVHARVPFAVPSGVLKNLNRTAFKVCPF